MHRASALRPWLEVSRNEHACMPEGARKDTIYLQFKCLNVEYVFERHPFIIARAAQAQG